MTAVATKTPSAQPAILPTYNRTPIAFTHGEGVYLYSTEGRRYLDFGSGIAVTSLGHCHPHLVKALNEQASKLWHCSNIYTIPGQQLLAERLVANTFADSVFFTNSGAEAVECGIKMIRHYHYSTGNPGKYRILCADHAFHGRTLTTIFAGGQKKHTEGFGPPVPGFDHVAFGNLNEMRAAVNAETAAILVEPVQGEGGYSASPPGYLQGLRDICEEFGLLLMFDEVQTGNGRTGKLYAYENYGVAPDIMATAKGLGGGFPVGACLSTAKAATGMVAGTHGSTFGGNPLAMAVGNAVLDVLLQPGFLDKVAAAGKALHAKLRPLVQRHPKVFVEVRGLGLMAGLRCAEAVPSGEMVGKLREAGLLSIGAGENVVRLAPPLIIDDSHIAEAVSIIDKVASAWAFPAENVRAAG
ncbi:MAG: aspartate aminotransferase family protein [Rhodospirillaceae bacterium]|nr:aspartate aminotransferase family protein [Rhodospirillaceae bacterium]